MQQVADWLEKLGLGQYAQRFAENDISFSVLPDLTDQDLRRSAISTSMLYACGIKRLREDSTEEKLFGPLVLRNNRLDDASDFVVLLVPDHCDTEFLER